MSSDRWPLARWAGRNPRRRWPLVLALIVALIGLAGAVAPPPGITPTDHPTQEAQTS